MNVALVTCERFRTLTHDDALLADALARRCINARAAVWTDKSEDWNRFDCAILRSTWDYHTRPVEFAEWINCVSLQTQLVNAPILLHWNMHKRYLLALEQTGIEIVPTLLVERNIHESPERLLEQIDTSEFVLKPAISASAHRTFVFADGHTDPAAAPEILRELARDGDVLVQPFLREIYDRGERSLIFFSGTFSHAVRRAPLSAGAAGGERREAAIAPSDAEIDAAYATLGRLCTVPIYARVDLLPLNSGRIVLTELELIEPALYFEHHPPSADMFARAVSKGMFA